MGKLRHMVLPPQLFIFKNKKIVFLGKKKSGKYFPPKKMWKKKQKKKQLTRDIFQGRVVERLLKVPLVFFVKPLWAAHHRHW